MIVLDNVCKTYSTGVSALNGVNLRIHKGEFVFIVGSSGSGKSTLFKLLLRELEPTSGKILLDGVPIGEVGARYRSILGYVPQKVGYYPDYTAKDFLNYISILFYYFNNIKINKYV